MCRRLIYASSRRGAGRVDLTLHRVFSFLAWSRCVAGYTYAAESWAINEHSNIPPKARRSIFKTVIPLAGAFVLMQGIVEIIRCIICLKPAIGPRVRKTCGSGCRQAEAGAAGEGRGHPEAGPVRRQAGAQMKLRKELWFGFSLIALIVAPRCC